MNHVLTTDPTRLAVGGFCLMDLPSLLELRTQMDLALPTQHLQTLQRYFMARERRDPTVGELRFFDALSRSANARSELLPISELIAPETQARAFADVCRMQKALCRTTPPTTADLTATCTKYLARAGIYAQSERLFAGQDAFLAANAGGLPPRLLLTLTHASAALMQSSTPKMPKKAAILRLMPAGNEPFATEIARFCFHFRKKGIYPLALTGEEGVLPHLLALPGACINLTAFPTYDPSDKLASLCKATEPSFLFAVPQRHLYAFFCNNVPLFHVGTVKQNDVFQLLEAAMPQMTVDLELLRRLCIPSPIKLTVGAAPTSFQTAFTEDATALLSGIEGEGFDEEALLTFFKESTSHGADLTRASATAVLMLPREKGTESLAPILPTLLAVHRATAELSLPLVNTRTEYTDLKAPCLSFFLHAPKCTPKETENLTDFPSLRAVFWNK